jgi:hypothetical protein
LNIMISGAVPSMSKFLIYDNYKIECRATRTSDKREGRIRCRGRVSIPCRLVTPPCALSRNYM